MNSSPAIIRRARASDSPAIDALYVELTGDNAVRVLPERIDSVHSDARTCLLVAEVDGYVCGTAHVSLCSDVMYGSQPFAVVENIVVARGARARGIGKRLMAHVESFCLDQDCSKIMLLSSASRVEAHAFFEKAGFAGDKKRGFVKYRRYLMSVGQSVHVELANEEARVGRS